MKSFKKVKVFNIMQKWHNFAKSDHTGHTGGMSTRSRVKCNLKWLENTFGWMIRLMEN